MTGSRQKTSQHEVLKMRQLIAYDWPGVVERIRRVGKGLSTDSKRTAQTLITQALNSAMTGYRDTVFAVEGLGKLSDPIRLAAFALFFLNEIEGKSQQLGITKQAKEEGNDTSGFRLQLYNLFFDNQIQEILREHGYEQKILVGGDNHIFHTDASGRHLHAVRVGASGN